MDLTELRALIGEGESETLEFKRSTGELRAGMETLCAFLNGQGGRVLVGVTNSGRIQGQQIADSTLRDVASAIGRLEPSVRIRQERIPVRDELEVLVLEALRSDDGPYTYDGRPYERIGPTTQRMAPAEYERRLLSRLQSQHRWENRIAESV